MKYLAVTIFTFAAMRAMPVYADSISDQNSNYQSSKTFQVMVKGDRRDDRSEVMDEALYEAAIETLENGFDWFYIVNSEVEKDVLSESRRGAFEGGVDRRPVTSCGLLGCSTRYETQYSSRAEIGQADTREVTYKVRLNFKAGSGTHDGSKDIYFAKAVKRSYK